MRAALYVSGAVIEFIGIILVASPDLLPYAARFSDWMAKQYRQAQDHLGRLLDRLFRRRRDVTVQVTPGGAIAAAGEVTFKKSVAEDASLEDKVRYLLTRDEEAQRDVRALDRRVDALQNAIDTKLAALRSTMTTHVDESLVRAHHEYLALRLVGVVFVVAGLALATTGNFVD